MSDLIKKGFSVREIESLKEDRDSFTEDIVEVTGFTKEEAFKSSEKGFFFMPNKIKYSRKSAPIEDVISGLSKNKRKRVRKAIKTSSGLEFTTESPVTQESYEEWYSKLYVPGTESRSHGLLIAKEDWWKEKGERFGLFLRKDGEVVAGILARSFKKDSMLPERFSISFSAVREDFRKRGIGDYLNVLAIDYARKCGFDYVFRGKDTNLYGFHLSAGIPSYKISLGFEIIPDKKSPDILIRFNRLDSMETVFFVSYKGDMSLCGNLIASGEVSRQEVGEYLCSTVKEIKVFRRDGNSIKLVETVSGT